MSDILPQPDHFDVMVIGGGPAGVAAAIAIAATGASTALIARRLPYGDNRTTALLGDSIDLLDRIDVWRRCTSKSAALRVMRLVDDTDRLIRAPEVAFRAEEIGLDAFGYNIENRELMVALEQRADELPHLIRFDDEAVIVSPDETAVAVSTRQGRLLSAALVVGADGRKSLCRDAAGISVSRKSLPQAALTFNVSHNRPHRNVSTEFHTSAGPCVFVPLPGRNSSVVWVMQPRDAERMLALSDDELAAAAEKQSHSILGKITVQPGRNLFPLSFERPQHFASKRIALVGEAAHVVPPIGAQGLNMGLRDAGALADIVRDARERGDDLGSPAVLQRFENARRGDINGRSMVIDLVNRSLLSDLLPVQAARAFGLHLLSGVGVLRRLAMREGLAMAWRPGRR